MSGLARSFSLLGRTNSSAPKLLAKPIDSQAVDKVPRPTATSGSDVSPSAKIHKRGSKKKFFWRSGRSSPTLLISKPSEKSVLNIRHRAPPAPPPALMSTKASISEPQPTGQAVAALAGCLLENSITRSSLQAIKVMPCPTLLPY